MKADSLFIGSEEAAAEGTPKKMYENGIFVLLFTVDGGIVSSKNPVCFPSTKSFKSDEITFRWGAWSKECCIEHFHLHVQGYA